jgi:hypothetical protein
MQPTAFLSKMYHTTLRLITMQFLTTSIALALLAAMAHQKCDQIARVIYYL